jgi:hypothetical protein
MTTTDTGRRLLIAIAALIVVDLICVFLAVASDITPWGPGIVGFEIVGFVPLPMMALDLVLAWLAARNVRPPVGRIAAILLGVICVISVLAGLFDGDMTSEAMTTGSVLWGVVLIVLTTAAGTLAIIRAKELRRDR